ncbi:hypothetical protein DFJ73DRAFT_782770 [Zopfochytrium polystomum]|nr:hypothetical protein DFJ73DRAFT_782770 [Zopfochytrium polystomum]
MPQPSAADRASQGRHPLPRRCVAAPAASVVSIAVRFLLLLLPVISVLLPFALAAGPSSSESKTGTTENVGGVSVQIGDKVGTQGLSAAVYHAKHGSTDVIYKEPLKYKKLWPKEVEATRAAGQLVAAEGEKMVQKKVGTTGLKDWLKTQHDNPEAKSKYLSLGENAKNNPGKVKLSDAIHGQITKQQKDVGKATDKHTVESQHDDDYSKVRMACRVEGFQFRAGRQLFRRAGKAACNKRVAAASSPSKTSGGGKAGGGVINADVRRGRLEWLRWRWKNGMETDWHHAPFYTAEWRKRAVDGIIDRTEFARMHPAVTNWWLEKSDESQHRFEPKGAIAKMISTLYRLPLVNYRSFDPFRSAIAGGPLCGAERCKGVTASGLTGAS